MSILDTAVKIGLGALIGGVTTYFVAKLTHEKQLERDEVIYAQQVEKEKATRKRELLEQVAEQIDIFSNSLTEVTYYTRFFIHLREDHVAASDHTKDEFREHISNVRTATASAASAQSKLLLLGHREANRHLEKYLSAASTFTNNAWNESDSLTEAKLDEQLAAVQYLEAKFFKTLSGLYK